MSCFVACTRLSYPLCPSVPRSVRWSVHPSKLLFFCVHGRFLQYCSCPNAWLTFFITAPAHLHATWAAVYPAWFSIKNSYYTLGCSHLTGMMNLVLRTNADYIKKINHLTEKITGLNSGRACAHLIGMIN